MFNVRSWGEKKMKFVILLGPAWLSAAASVLFVL